METEILATIGPASVDFIEQMHDKGLAGIRLNSSHAKHDFCERVIRKTRQINPGIFIVYDIKGPKVRIGDLPAPLHLRAGMTVVLRTDLPKQEGSDFPKIEDFTDGIPVNYSNLEQYVTVGHRLYIDDGYIGLRVIGVAAGRITCKVMFGDVLRSRKGLNHPDSCVEYPYTMPSDVEHIQFAVQHKVDYIADSFTQNGADVLELKNRLRDTPVKIISKIENPEGVRNFDEILKHTDAVMIARGDLGVELDPWMVPELQKQIIEKCNHSKKPVITATQMLESMIDNPHPSRADVSDIANAIYDGADVVMLSAETSVGKYPVACVEMMHRIGDYVEETDRFRRMGKVHSTLGKSA